MSLDAHQILTDKAYLTAVQYRTGANLAARQSIYAFQQPKIDLVAAVLGLAGLAGTETVADIGCGNGIYLAGLARRGHAGRLLGVDLSPGMLAAARAVAPGAGLTLGDAAALPLADGAVDLTLAPHMLYHVPDRRAAVAEFRRITRPGGQLLVVLNGTDHLAELRELVIATAAAAGPAAAEIVAEYETSYRMVTLDTGAELLAEAFHWCSGMISAPSWCCPGRSRLQTMSGACGPRRCLTRTASPGPWARASRSVRTARSGSGPTAACLSADEC